MASQGPPSSSSFPSSMGPGAHPTRPGEPGSILKELQEIRSSYSINVSAESLKLGYNFKGQGRTYNIPYSSMPISDGTRWLLYGGPGRAKVTGLFTLDLIRGAENMAGRPLTQQEAEGFAFHCGKRMRYNYIGTLTGFATGYLVAARSWKTMKFPFVKQKPIESYNSFPAKRLPILSGTFARAAWQVTRANLYAAISLIFAQFLFGSMGDSVMSVGLYRDTRTQDIVMAMKGNFDRIRMNRSQPGQGPPVAQEQPGHDRDPQSEDFYGNSYSRSNTYSGDQSFSDVATDIGAVDDSLDDASMRQRERQLDSRTPQYPTSRPPPEPTGRRSSEFFFDDASPTAGNDPDMATSRGYQPSSGSTWERLRKGVQPQQQSPPKPSVRQNSVNAAQQEGGWRTQGAQNFDNNADSFSFSRRDEDRQLAREQAQKEFDAMLDKERREGGSEGYTNSSRAAETGSETPAQTGGSVWERRRRG